MTNTYSLGSSSKYYKHIYAAGGTFAGNVGITGSLEVNGYSIKVGFSTYGNKHLFSDTFGRSSVLTKEDLKDLGSILERSTYIGHAELTHERNDNITHFYYYKAELHGKTIKLNVAKDEEKQPNGKNRIKYYLYSITDINE